MPYEYRDEDEYYHGDWLERSDAYIDAGKLVIPKASAAQSLQVLKGADVAFKYFVHGEVSNDLLKRYTDKGVKDYFYGCIWEIRKELDGCVLPQDQFVALRPSLECFLKFLCAINESELKQSIKQGENPFSLDAVKQLKAMGEKEDETFKRRARKNRKSVRDLVSGVYQVRARVLVLRLDLGYRHDGYVLDAEFDEACQANKEDIDLICEHRDHFVKHLKSRFPNGLLGYVWRLEYGEQKGYHLHTFTMLDGNLHHKDVALCQELGEHWSNEITSKKGLYYNCNARKSKYRNLAIGMTNHDDVAQQAGIDNIIKYFSKDDWIFQVKSGKGRRAIGRSEIPKQLEKPRGRKRSCQALIEDEKFVKRAQYGTSSSTRFIKPSLATA